MKGTPWKKQIHPEDSGWLEYVRRFMSITYLGEITLRIWFSGAGVWRATITTPKESRYTKALNSTELNAAMEEATQWAMDLETRNAG